MTLAAPAKLDFNEFEKRPSKNGVFSLVFFALFAFAPYAMAQQNAAPDKSFKGYPCTKDCSGHQAGYKWAEEHDIDDPAKCGGTSPSFIEGCKAWANDSDDEDNKDEADMDDERED